MPPKAFGQRPQRTAPTDVKKPTSLSEALYPPRVYTRPSGALNYDGLPCLPPGFATVAAAAAPRATRFIALWQHIVPCAPNAPGRPPAVERCPKELRETGPARPPRNLLKRPDTRPDPLQVAAVAAKKDAGSRRRRGADGKEAGDDLDPWDQIGGAPAPLAGDVAPEGVAVVDPDADLEEARDADDDADDDDFAMQNDDDDDGIDDAGGGSDDEMTF